MDFKTRNQIIFENLKESIISGKYKPNERIIISKIAKQFGISEIPIREVMTKLKAEGYVEIKPHIGARVTEYNMDEIEKIYQVRWELEGLATKMATQYIDKKLIEKLQKIINQMGQAINKKKYEEIGLLNKNFHKIIYAKCGNEFLYNMIFNLWNLTGRTPGVFMLNEDRTKKAAYEHELILKAIKNEDCELAKKLTIDQKKASLRIMKEYFQKNKKTVVKP